MLLSCVNVCVCACVCKHVCACVCKHVHACTHIYGYIYMCECMSICVCVYAYVWYVWVCMCVSVCEYVGVWECVCRVCMYVSVYVCECVWVCVYVSMCVSVCVSSGKKRMCRAEGGRQSQLSKYKCPMLTFKKSLRKWYHTNIPLPQAQQSQFNGVAWVSTLARPCARPLQWAISLITVLNRSFCCDGVPANNECIWGSVTFYLNCHTHLGKVCLGL